MVEGKKVSYINWGRSNDVVFEESPLGNLGKQVSLRPIRPTTCDHHDLVCHSTIGAIAKWLRRQIRNLFLFEGAGSNPAGVGVLLLTFFFSECHRLVMLKVDIQTKPKVIFSTSFRYQHNSTTLPLV